MKLSLEFQEDRHHAHHHRHQIETLKAKIPLTILNQPFISSTTIPATTTSSSDLSFSLSTNFLSGPSLRLSYHPTTSTSTASPPFSLSLKSGLGLFGSPNSSPLVFSANFSLSPTNTPIPTFSLHLKPQFGHFSLRKSTFSDPVSDKISGPFSNGGDKVNYGSYSNSGVNLGSESHSNCEFGSGLVSEGSSVWQELKLEPFGGKDGVTNPSSLENGGVHSNGGIGFVPERQLAWKNSRKDRFLSGVGVMAKTSFPVTKRVMVNMRWGVNFPADGGKGLPSFSPLSAPFFSALSFRLRRSTGFPVTSPPPPYISVSPSLSCHVSSRTGGGAGVVSMDSPSPDLAVSVDSVARDLKNQSLGSDAGDYSKRLGLKLEDLNWDHSFVRELPGDPRTDTIPREVLHACYTKVLPSAEAENPQLVAWSESVAELLDLDPQEFERPDFPLLFSGASTLVGALPYAQCYGGHQFGMWAGQLGDGRAITLGEIINSKSERWELQLKGAGKTPYSRFADGLAVLRSSIREFLCSEAMHSLGIPTTRALCLVTTGKYVTRDMFYDGNPKEEPGAIVCRVSQSFLRFGSYQIHASRGKEDLGIVRALADYAIRKHFPHIENMSRSESLSFTTGDEDHSVVDLTSNKYAAWVVEVAERTATLIANWQGVGFTHGVLNTDNMSILGLTIDYGPFGFLDAFDPSYTPNTTDLPGRRYCFANQPDIGLWNIAQFASTLSAAQLINDKEANYAMERYGTKFMDEYQAIMTKKLGLPKYNKQLISKLLNNMAVDKVDYTNFFRLLSNIKADPSIPEEELLVPLKAVLLDIGKERKEAWISWAKSYIEELASGGISDEERKVSMNAVNPKYVLRNYLCQSAIDAAELGDFGEVRRLLKIMERPYDEQPGMEKYARLPPAWAYRPGVCMLSCSS